MHLRARTNQSPARLYRVLEVVCVGSRADEEIQPDAAVECFAF